MKSYKKHFLSIVFNFVLIMEIIAGINLIRLDSVQVFPVQAAQFGIEVLNEDTFVSFQLDISLPTGFSYQNGSALLNPLRKGNHLISASVIGNNTLRLISFSLNNETFSGNSGEVASFTLSTPLTVSEHPLIVSNFLIGSPNAQNIASGKIDGAVRTMGPLTVTITSDTDTICAGNAVVLSSVINGGGWFPVVSWSSVPEGLYGNQPTVTFIPAMSMNCSVQVNDGFQTAVDNLSVFVSDPPVAFAGTDIVSCFDAGIQLNGAVQNATHSVWMGGSGVFTDSANTQTVYHPSESDLLAGSVELVLKAFGASLCPVHADTLILFLQKPATVDAGSGTIIPFQGAYQNTDAIAGNFSALHWASNGDGYFEDQNLLHCTYHPGSNDVTSGQVTLSLTAFGMANCPAVSNSLELIVLSEDDNVMLLPVIEATLADTVVLELEVNNRIAFTAFAATINLPSGMEWLIETATLSERAHDHVFDMQVSAGQLTIQAFSATESPFSGNNGGVFTISFISGNASGSFPLTIQNAALYDSTGMNVLTSVSEGMINITLVNIRTSDILQPIFEACIHPIPINFESVLQINLSEAALVNLVAIELDGRVLYRKELGYFTEGKHQFLFQGINNTLLQKPAVLLVYFQLSDGKTTLRTIKHF